MTKAVQNPVHLLTMNGDTFGKPQHTPFLENRPAYGLDGFLIKRKREPYCVFSEENTYLCG